MRRVAVELDSAIREGGTATYFASNVTVTSKKATSYLYKLEEGSGGRQVVHILTGKVRWPS